LHVLHFLLNCIVPEGGSGLVVIDQCILDRH
jgi:hypothetical protein